MRTSGRAPFWQLVGLAMVSSLFIVACGGLSSTEKSSTGGVVTFAEQPSSPPNYIMPLMSGAYTTDANLLQFSDLMYPPSFWFGQGNKNELDTALSLGKTPVYSSKNTVVTITLKHWRWSNGQPVTARDVIFWLNILSAATDPNAPAIGTSSTPGPGYGDFVPGEFPQNVVSYAQTGTHTVVLHLNASYSPTWFTDNELYQLYAIPQSVWDKYSSSGAIGNYDVSAEARTTLPNTSPAWYVPKNPGTATSGALGVAQYLNSQSQDLTTYATNPLWKVVDGAFKLTQFTADGFAKMVPNQAYSGSTKPKISALEELPFTTDSAEFDALRSGSLTIGYVDSADLDQRSVLEREEGYKFSPWYTFSTEYSPYNFTNATAGPIFKQLYFRQAFQSLVDEPEYIKDFDAGIGTITNGPMPTYPPHNSALSALAIKGAYPYNPAQAVSLLKANGWTVDPGGTSYCSKPGSGTGECGTGVKANQQLTFGMLYISGSTPLTNEIQAMQSTLKQKAGIVLTLKQGSFSQVLGIADAGCSVSSPCNDWDLAVWTDNASWTYNPAPTGEDLFETGASVNVGYYSSSVNDANIERTHTAPTAAAEITALHTYENLLVKQLPVVWLPNGPYQLTMYKSDLKGFAPQGIFAEISPQYYSLSH